MISILTRGKMTMNKSYVLLFAMIVMFVSGCSNVPTKDIQVDAQADPKANFSGYKSYTWLATAAILNALL